MSQESHEGNLRESLTELEQQLESPVVPGELPEWLESVDRLYSQCLSRLHQEIATRHRDEMEEIVEQDSSLFSRVEQLKTEDRRILEEAERISKILSSLAQHSEGLEPDEACAGDAVEGIVEEGLHLVLRIRKQEAAIETWLWEAFERDRGVAD